MTTLARLAQRLGRSTLVEAARVAERVAVLRGRRAEVGRDALPAEEPIRFVASDRMRLAANDLAGVEPQGEQLRIVANLLGLAGASPSLPPPYSELQLQRRRRRDWSFGQFLNLFDHRALSFFYRIAQKYGWPLLAERAGGGAGDPVQGLLISLSGLGVDKVHGRLDVPDAALVTLTAHLSDARRSAASVETVLRVLTGLPLRVVEASPRWMDLPESEQTRLGGPHARFAQLGDGDASAEVGMGHAAILGAAVLDAQHHYVVEIGPLSYRRLLDFCCRPDARRLMTQLCVLAAGLEQRPLFRLLIEVGEIPQLRLGDADVPGLLGWTTWLGPPDTDSGIAADCVIPIDSAAVA